MKILEILVSVSILVILALTITGSLGGFRGSTGLISVTETAVSALSSARADTLAARLGKQYGVHFASTTVTIFSGAVFSPTATGTTIFELMPGVEIASVALQGGGADVVFERLTGKTAQYGSVILTSHATGATSSVTIEKTGSISSP